MIKCNFSDIRNCWEMREPKKVSGNWCDVKTLMIKTAAKCKNYSSDVIYDIEDMNERINAGEEFECYQIYYDTGVRCTLELTDKNKTLEQKLEELKFHCSKVFKVLKLKFSQVNDRDYTLECKGVRI